MDQFGKELTFLTILNFLTYVHSISVQVFVFKYLLAVDLVFSIVLTFLVIFIFSVFLRLIYM